MKTSKNRDALVSIIVPAYNVESYIGRCIESLLCQNYEKIEVIVIEDGSSDATLEKIEKYTKRDNRVKMVRQSHDGPNRARERGVKLAKGEYVMFVDSDDHIECGSILKLVSLFKEYEDIDAIRFNARWSNGEVVFPIINPGEEKRLLGHNEIADLLLNTFKLNSLCFQIYRTERVKPLRAFKFRVKYGEDFLTNLEFYQKDSSILAIGDVLYNYCDNPESTTHNRSYEQSIKNVEDRVFVSHEAIEKSHLFRGCSRGKVVYNQIKMIKGSIMDVTRVKEYRKDIFMKDLRNILPEGWISKNDVELLEGYARTLSLPERIKNYGVIRSIAKSNYNFIWRYMKVYGMIVRFKL